MPMIGFCRNVSLVWLEQAAVLTCMGEDRSGLHSRLEPIVAQRVTSDVNRRNTLDIIVNIWLRTREEYPRLHATAVELFQETTAQDDHLVLHYGLTMLAFPFFRAGVRMIGQALRFGGEVRTSTLHRQMTANVGGLGAVHDACKRIIFSLRDWGILVNGTGRHRYVARESRVSPSSPALECWLLAAALAAHPAETLPVDDLLCLPELFPFDLAKRARPLRNCDLLRVHRLGGDLEIVSLTEV